MLISIKRRYGKGMFVTQVLQVIRERALISDRSVAFRLGHKIES